MVLLKDELKHIKIFKSIFEQNSIGIEQCQTRGSVRSPSSSDRNLGKSRKSAGTKRMVWQNTFSGKGMQNISFPDGAIFKNGDQNLF